MKQILIPALMMMPILAFGQHTESEAQYLEHLSPNHALLSQNKTVQILETTLIDDRKFGKSKFIDLMLNRPSLSNVDNYMPLKFEPKGSDQVLPELEDYDFFKLQWKKYTR